MVRLGCKLVHSAGASICLNGSMNYRFGQYRVLDYGPARLNFVFDRGRLNFQPQFNLLFIGDVIFCTHFGGRMDWVRTLKSGTVIFSNPEMSIPVKGP
ncbi:MAG: hypothetical protein LBH06_08675 [Rikenellaceae bacterium]|jgi:hypothetical protein|nr:hypothetical protein [Rikenellaceae bacterium]